MADTEMPKVWRITVEYDGDGGFKNLEWGSEYGARAYAKELQAVKRAGRMVANNAGGWSLIRRVSVSRLDCGF